MRQQGGRRFGWIALVLLWAGVVCPTPAAADDVPAPVAAHTETAPTAAPALAPPLTLTLALDEVLQHNPALQAARYRHEAALYRVPQAQALKDPMIGVNIEGIGSGRYEDIEYSASQEWPFPGKRRLRRRIAAGEAAIVQADYDTLERDVTAQTKTAYFALYLVERAIDVNRRNRELLEQAERAAEASYAVGESSMRDVLQAQTELARLSNELIGLQQERATAIVRLNTLMNRPADAPLVVTTRAGVATLPYTVDELEARMRAARPSLTAATLTTEQQTAELGLAKLEYLPDVTTMVEARQFRGSDGIQEVDTKVAVNVPIWFWGKQRARILEMKAMLAAAQAAQVRATNEAVVELRDAYARLVAARDMAQVYDASILPQAEQSLTVAQDSFAAHRVPFVKLVETERAWKTAQLEYHRVLVQFETAWADLERAVGQSLEKNEVKGER